MEGEEERWKGRRKGARGEKKYNSEGKCWYGREMGDVKNIGRDGEKRGKKGEKGKLREKICGGEEKILWTLNTSKEFGCRS